MYERAESSIYERAANPSSISIYSRTAPPAGEPLPLRLSLHVLRASLGSTG
jgi:hypothetical protein